MIIPVKKFLLFGTGEDLDDFFERAQHQGYIEFISPAGKRALEMPQETQTLLSALRILRKLPLHKPYVKGGSTAFAVETAQRVLAIKGEIDRLSEEVRILDAEIVRVAPFGDFSMEDIDFIEREGGRKVQFFCMKSSKSHEVVPSDEIIYVDTVYDLDYFITINKQQTSYPQMIEMRVDRSAKQLQSHQAFVKESLHLLETELKEFAGHIDFFQSVLVEMLNDYHLAAAKKEVQFPLGQTLFSVEAWIPENKVTPVFSMINGMAIQVEEIAVEEKERIPTYMENKGIPRVGEDLVKVYDIPAANDKDPSGWIFWSFVFFFALIVNDAGYGLLFLLTGLFLRYKFPQAKGMGKRLIKLTLALAVGCILWGVTTASYFGIEFSPTTKISQYSLPGHLAEKKAEYHLAKQDDVNAYWVKEYPEAAGAKDAQEFFNKTAIEKEGRLSYEAFDDFKDNVLLEISLLVGVIHIALSLVRYLNRHIAGIGWILFLIGGYLYFPSVLQCTSILHFTGIIDKETAAKSGIQLIYAGVGIAVILAFIQKRLKGFSEVTTIVQVFADVLSYLRLYALALAGAMMASTFNDLGKSVGLVAGIFVVLIGHAVNIALTLMAGVIHGLRLNFIEWYHHSFEGGGRLFRPLKKMK